LTNPILIPKVIEKNVSEELKLIISEGGNTMLEVTQAATQQLNDYFQGRKIEPIRIFLNEGG